MRFSFCSDPQVPDSVRPPVIIVGMHRSGTTLLTRLLSRLGLFVGKETDRHEESIFFQRLNEWMLRSCEGSWDRPEPFIDLLGQETPRTLVVEHLQYIQSSPRARRHTGWWAWLRHGGVGLDAPWGWKDPRSTITLPLWLELFPDARVLSIKRHGIDVARSLKERAENGTAYFEARYRKLRKKYGCWYWYRRKKGGFSASTRCATLDGGMELWDTYLTHGQDVISSLGNQAKTVKYESLLQNPVPVLRDLVTFCGLPSVDNSEIRDATTNIDASRAFAYRDASVYPDAHCHSEVLERHGYTP